MENTVTWVVPPLVRSAAAARVELSEESFLAEVVGIEAPEHDRWDQRDKGGERGRVFGGDEREDDRDQGDRPARTVKEFSPILVMAAWMSSRCLTRWESLAVVSLTGRSVLAFGVSVGGGVAEFCQPFAYVGEVALVFGVAGVGGGEPLGDGQGGAVVLFGGGGVAEGDGQVPELVRG